MSDQVKNERECLEAELLKNADKIDQLTEALKTLHMQNNSLVNELDFFREEKHHLISEREAQGVKLVKEFEKRLRSAQRAKTTSKGETKELQELLKEKQQEIIQLQKDSINDPKGLEPLTPNHLLTMKTSVLPPPPGIFMAEDLYARIRWRGVQYLTEQIWSRWKKEYLASITLRQSWHSSRRNVRIGDIVIVKEEGIPHSEWRLGSVLDVCEDEDGLVRRATIQLGNKKLEKECQQPINPSILECPIHKLVVLVENN
ncbi:uncharacterized protein LOC134355175 [Mobula hypostoma]|uniref:uncharacterized protein LOC134355175 n=1 Tax=Mobula hypostoma TaxID=723540 RepID=UPI002FC30692